MYIYAAAIRNITQLHFKLAYSQNCAIFREIVLSEIQSLVIIMDIVL